MARRDLPRVPPHGRMTRGFMAWLQCRPDITADELARLDERVQVVCEALGLELSGYSLELFVSARGRTVNPADQVALIDALVDIGGLRGLRVSPIGPWDCVLYPSQRTCIEVHTGDLAIVGLALLYRSGRIDPALYLQILSGAERPVGLH